MKKQLAHTAAAAALSIACQPALAAVDDEAAIVVTATRFTSGVSRAIGAAVIAAEDIAQSTATTLAEVLDRLGGVSVRSNLNGTADASLDLRGFGVTGNQNTLVLVDGQRLSDNELAAARISSIPLRSIERIEILRGAGAVIYGPGATAGVINIVTREPGAAGRQGYLSGLIGSMNTHEVRGGGDFVGERFGMTLNASQRTTDNWRRNSENRVSMGNGEVRLRLEDGFAAVRFAADEQRGRLPGPRSKAQLESDPRGTSTPHDFSDSSSHRLALTVEKKLGAIRLGADLTTRRKDADFHYDYGFGMFSSNATRGAETAFTPRASWQTRLGAARNELTAGLEWRAHDYRNDGLADYGFGPSLSAERASQRNTAWYLQNQTVFPTGTELAVGVRREHIRQSWQERLTPLDERLTRHALSAWEIALRQTLGGGFVGHLRKGESYRVANVDENRCFFAPCTPLLLPQTSRDTGVGVEWGRGRDRVRAELFEMKVRDELYFNRLEGFFGANMNMPPLTRRGLQVDAAWQPRATLAIHATYAHTRARFDAGVFNGIDVSGNAVPLVPRDRATIQVGWQFLPTTRLTLAHAHVGKQRYDNDQANRYSHMPAYGITDLKISHRDAPLTLNAGINNVFDKASYSYAVINDPLAPTSFNAYPELRRMVYVSAEHAF